MAGPDFYNRDQDSSLPEDRPRGTTPGTEPVRSFKAFWIGGGLLLVIAIVVVLGVVG